LLRFAQSTFRFASLVVASVGGGGGVEAVAVAGGAAGGWLVLAVSALALGVDGVVMGAGCATDGAGLLVIAGAGLGVSVGTAIADGTFARGAGSTLDGREVLALIEAFDSTLAGAFTGAAGAAAFGVAAGVAGARGAGVSTGAGASATFTLSAGSLEATGAGAVVAGLGAGAVSSFVA
jgi:hypothetical protein